MTGRRENGAPGGGGGASPAHTRKITATLAARGEHGAHPDARGPEQGAQGLPVGHRRGRRCKAEGAPPPPPPPGPPGRPGPPPRGGPGGAGPPPMRGRDGMFRCAFAHTLPHAGPFGKRSEGKPPPERREKRLCSGGGIVIVYIMYYYALLCHELFEVSSAR